MFLLIVNDTYFFFNFKVFLFYVLGVKFFFDPVSAVESFFQSSIKFMLLFTFLNFEKRVDIMKSLFVIVQQFFFLFVVQNLVLFYLFNKLVVLGLNVAIIINCIFTCSFNISDYFIGNIVLFTNIRLVLQHIIASLFMQKSFTFRSCI